MNKDEQNTEELTFDVKKIIDDIDNVKLDIDLYAVCIDEKVLTE